MMNLIPWINSRRRTSLVAAALAAFCAFILPARAQQTVVSNYSGNSLFIVDLSTGVRTTLSDASTGTGTNVNRPVGIGRENDGTILVGQDLTNSVLFRIDPTNGNRTVLSSNSVGTGPSLAYIYGIAVDPNGIIYVTDFSPGSIVKIDGTTGDRTVIASGTVGGGDTWGSPWGIAAEPDGSLLVAMYSLNAVYRVNPTTGVRTTVSSSTVGTGPDLNNPTGIARLSDGTIVVVNRDATDYVVRIDPSTGNRTVVSSSTVGSGPTIGTRFTISFDTNGTLYSADFSNNAIVKVDPSTGNRTVVSNSSTGSGPAFNSPIGILPNAVASISHPSNPPVISSATTGSATYGSSFSYAITASNTPTSFAATGLPTGLSVDTTTGAISGTPTQTGSFTVTLGATNDDGTGEATLTLTVAKKDLTVSGVTATSKTYDGGITATISTTGASLVGIVGSDAVTLDSSGATGTFDTKNMGTGKTVTVAGLALTGTAAANYTLTQPTATADISAKTLTVTGATVSDKVYDAGLTATPSFSGASLSGVVSGDDVTLNSSSATAAFATKTVGTAKSVTISGLTLTGNDASNYSLTQPTATANITKKGVTVSGVTAANKTYDGNATATPSFGSASLVGVVSGDDVALASGSATAAFANKNIGTGKAVTISGLALTGGDAANYSLTQPTTTATITAKGLTVTGVTASNRTYDGTTVATLNLGGATLVGAVSGDDVTLVTTNAAGAFADKAIGTGRTVTVTGLTLAGTDASNYTLAQPTATADISARTLTVTGTTVSNKVYDAALTAAPSFSGASLSGVVSGDDVSLVSSSATAAFATKTVGTAKTVTVSGLTLAGSDASNYALTQPTATADIAAKTVTVSGTTAANKTYDGNTTAAIDTTGATLNGVVSGDTVNLVIASPTGAFADANIGTAKTVTISGVALTGADATNYTLSTVTTTANITAATATVTLGNLSATYDRAAHPATATTSPAGLAVTFTYDGTPLAVTPAEIASFSGAIGSTVTVNVTGATSGTVYGSGPYTIDSDVATAAVHAGIVAAGETKLVRLTIAADQGSYIGSTANGVTTQATSAAAASFQFAGGAVGTFLTDAPRTAGDHAVVATVVDQNYTGTSGGTLAIAKAALTVTGATASNKTYDGNANAMLSLASASLSGVISGDTVSLDGGSATATFDTKSVGTGKLVTVAGIALNGADASNYTLTQPTTTADISAKTVTVSGVTAANKTYDGNATATPSFGSASLVGVVSGDDVALSAGGATAQFADKTVGAGKPVTIAGLALTGGDAANYSLTQPTTTANITAKGLTVTGVTASDRVYDGSIIATASYANGALAGAVSGDDVSLVTSSATAAFATKTVGAGKIVAIAGLRLGGTDAANYTLAQPTTTANITAKPLTVVGVTAADKVYDAGATATLSFAGATLAGVVSPDDVALVSSGATGAFATAGAGTAKTVTVTGLTLAGTDSANYTLTAPTLTADITKATATVALAALAQTYSGAPRAVTATTTPTGLTVAITYAGSGTAPIAVGSYAVVATINEANYQGSASGTLVVGKADQSLTFDQPASAPVNITITLNASASSSLPVSFAIVSGNATLSGSTLTLKDINPVTIRATQSGDDSFNPVSVERTVTASSKLAQTITFDAIATRRASDAAFALSATASSGLPVSFTVVSGPAIVAGSQLTLTGVSGKVAVRASQAGDDAYEAAADVTQSFDVIAADAHRIYFGATQTDDPVAIDLAPDGTSATLLCYLAGTKEAFVVSLRLIEDGSYETSVAPLSTAGASASTLAIHAAQGVTAFATDNDSAAGLAGRVTAKAVIERTFRGQLISEVFTGTIVELGLSFRAPVQPPTGPTAAIAGLYESAAINSAGGKTTTIVGTQGQVLVVSSTMGLTTGAMGGIGADGRFDLAADGATIGGAVDAPTATISTQVTVPGQVPVILSGVATTTVRTDRLVNLSSRARVSPLSSGTLITGFVIGGTEPKRVLLRAIGPTLTDFGIANALGNPKLRLFDVHGSVVAENDDWAGADAAATATQVGAFGLRAGSADAALVVTLAPGAYTMHVIDGGGTGVALAEIYDAGANPQGEYQRLMNISTRGTVDSGEGVLVGGFVVSGNSPKKVLIRGVGPTLSQFGVTGALANPKLSLYQNGTLLAQNDDWNTPQALNGAQVVASAADIDAAAKASGAFAYPDGSKDSAIIVTLAPGAYTAQVSGADGGTGVALVEIYEVTR